MATASPAWKGKLSVGGATPVAFTGGACTLVSGKTYQLNSSVQRRLDPSTARVWKDNGVTVAAANIASEDLLFGKVTFAAAYTVVGPVTCDGSYIAIAATANVKSASIERKANNASTDALNSNGWKTRMQVLKDVAASLSLYDDLDTDLDPGTVGTQSFNTLLVGGTSFLLEMDPTGAGTRVFRVWMVIDSGKVSYSPDSIIAGDVALTMNDRGNANAAAGAGWGAP